MKILLNLKNIYYCHFVLHDGMYDGTMININGFFTHLQPWW
jgi:hypothetical protein